MILCECKNKAHGTISDTCSLTKIKRINHKIIKLLLGFSTDSHRYYIKLVHFRKIKVSVNDWVFDIFLRKVNNFYYCQDLTEIVSYISTCWLFHLSSSRKSLINSTTSILISKNRLYRNSPDSSLFFPNTKKLIRK